VGLNEVVETSVKLVRPKAQDEAVSLTCVLEAVPDEINADRASIRQIILNLVMNAIQAVSANEGREVRVRTSCGDGKVGSWRSPTTVQGCPRTCASACSSRLRPPTRPAE
jgi:signal transduction histidine kinase